VTSYRVQREDDFDFESAEYAELFANSGATAFQHPVWLSVLYAQLAPRRLARKVVVVARTEDGRLVLVLPFVLRRRGPVRVLEYADLGVNDYAAPVADRSVLDEPDLTVLAADVRRALGSFDLLRIERVADDPAGLMSLIAGTAAKQHSYSTHLMELRPTVAAWRDELDPQFVRHLERKYKRLRPKGERRLRLVTDPAEVEPLMSQMQAFRAARFSERRGTDLVQEPDYFSFYAEVARRSIGAGPARLVALEVGGEPAAVALDLDEPDRELFLLVGYDVGRLRNYSLGLLIVDSLVQDCIGRNRQFFDLTVGDEGYKADFGARPRPLFEVRSARTVAGGVMMIGQDTYLRSRRVAKRVVERVEAAKRRRAESKRDRSSAPEEHRRTSPPPAR